MVAMQISGKRVLEASPQVLARMRWFIGHESAHFWVGQTVRYDRRDEAWIIEGAADLLAVRALERLVPGHDGLANLQSEIDECLKLVGTGEPLAKAEERGEQRAYYGCGAMLLAAAEGFARARDPSADAFDVIRALIAANRADGVVTADEWLAAFAATAGDAAVAGRVRIFVKTGVADPRAFWTELLAAAGVPHVVEGEGIRLL